MTQVWVYVNGHITDVVRTGEPLDEEDAQGCPPTLKIPSGHSYDKVQRLAQYEQYFQSLLHETASEHPDHESIARAKARARQAVKRGQEESDLERIQDLFPNDYLRLYDKDVITMKMKGLMRKRSSTAARLQRALSAKSLRPESPPPPPRPTAPVDKRTFIMEAPVQFSSGVQSQERHLFLFNDLLLIAKARTGGNFKLKDKVRVSELWLSRGPLDDVTELNKSADTSFVLGWPTTNVVATFTTQAARDLWWNTLQDVLKKEKEKDPPTTNIQVTYYDLSTAIEYCKTFSVGPEQTARDCVRLALEHLEMRGLDSAQFQLWAKTARDEAPYPLVGHERPFAIKLEDLGSDELIRRLKTLAHTLQAMGQDEGMYQQYIPLAIHLAEDHFLQHPSRDVQLLIACCIADVLRVYAPEAPYKDPDQVKTIFLFLIKQLSGLKDPKDPAFKRYFYLLENLAYVKSFNMCFDLEDCQEIFCNLFSLMFKIVNDEHSGKVKSFMLDVLCPLITESDVVSNELLDIILMNIVEPNKSTRKNAYLLAKDLVVKCSDTLEPYVQGFFNHVLILGKEEKGIGICTKVYDLIYELNKICPSVLLAVLPQLECKLKSNQESERLGSVSLLARMFSEKDSTLAKHHASLWRAFLGRFNDISIAIRTKCVQYSMHFLLNHPELRKDITETLKLRQHDSDENVRYEVVTAIVSTAKRDFEVVSDSEDLLEYVKERTLDKKFKIRKEAMSGLAMIYRKHLTDGDVPQATKKAVTWIKDKILHGYYMVGMEDRLLVERLLNTSLVPYTLPPEERMKKLYHLVGTIDDHATKALIELQKSQLLVRKCVSEWLELHRRQPSVERDREITGKIIAVSRFLPDSLKAQEFLARFSKNMLRDPSLLLGMETLVRPDMSCKDCTSTTSLILKKLGQPVMTNLYYNTVKMLLERISSVMVDYVAIRLLIGYVEDCLKGGNLIDEIGLHPNTAGERGLKLLVMLSFVFPHHFLHEDIIQHLISLLHMEEESIAPLVLFVLTFLGKYKPLDHQFPQEMSQLIPICKEFIVSGTPKQAKQAIRCLFKNTTENVDALFTDILEKVKENLNSESTNYRTAIVALGHIAYNLPDAFPVHIKNLVSRKIVKDLLVQESDGSGQHLDNDWCPEDELPEETRCKIEGLKTMAKWLLGLKNDKVSAQKTFRMLTAFMTHKGDLLQSGKLSKAEMSWLRLAAGCAMLKICEQKGVGDQFSPEQFYTLSTLMIDEVVQVRETLLMKLHKGLGRGLPNKCLPLDFMGFYVLSGFEEDKRIKSAARGFMVLDINKRREYAKSLTMGNSGCSVDKAIAQLPHILPDYMLVFALPVLVHCPYFTSHENTEELTRLRSCLWFILESLILKNDSYCFGFYKELIEKMKNHKDAVKPEDQNTNFKLWALCDLAMDILLQKTVNFELKDFPSEPRISPMYFKKHEEENFVNTRIYIPPELMLSGNGKRGLNMTNNTTTGVERPLRKLRARKPDPEPVDPTERDAKPGSASDTKIQLPGLEAEDSDNDDGEPRTKRTRVTKVESVE